MKKLGIKRYLLKRNHLNRRDVISLPFVVLDDSNEKDNGILIKISEDRYILKHSQDEILKISSSDWGIPKSVQEQMPRYEKEQPLKNRMIRNETEGIRFVLVPTKENGVYDVEEFKEKIKSLEERS